MSVDDSREAWQPGPDVRRHDGELIDEDRVWFAAPPPEIGQVQTADTTLAAGDTPRPVWLRLGSAAGVALAVLATIYALFAEPQFQPKSAVGWLIFAGFSLALAGAAAGAVLYLLRFRRQASFVGRDGFARDELRGGLADVRPRGRLHFADAARLYTAETRQYVNGVYTGTNYGYRWADEAGRNLVVLSGTFRAKDGRPKPHDAYWFAKSAQAAWNVHAFDAARRQFEADGHVAFPVDKNLAVRLGPGWMEFDRRGDVRRLVPEDVKSLTLREGRFDVRTHDASFFGKSGKYAFGYAAMPNAQVFLMCLETLVGFGFGGSPEAEQEPA